MPAIPGLSESNREALIIRWRRLLVLGLIDFFNGTNDFGKLIVKEILDIPDEKEVVALLTLGYPKDEGERITCRKSLNEIVCYNRYCFQD